VGNFLYIGSCTGICYALDKKSGEVRWEREIGEVSFHGDPITTDSLLIIPVDREFGAIYALTLSEGHLRWKYTVVEYPEIINGVTTDLMMNGNTVLGVTTNDKLVCLDIGNGNIVWDYQSPFTPEERYWNVGPATRDSTVYFIGHNGWLYKLNAQTGREMWKSDIGIRPTTNIVLKNNDIYIGSDDSTIYKLSSEDGTIISNKKLKGRTGLQLQIVDSLLYVFVRDDPGRYRMQTLLAVKTDLSGVVWESLASSDSSWSIKKVYQYRDWIIAGKANGEVLFLDPSTGHPEGSIKIDGSVRSIGFDNDVMYVGTISGFVHAIKIEY